MSSNPVQGGLQVYIPTDKLLAQAHRAEQSLRQHTQDILETMGKSLLELILEAYEEKSLGKIGSDGVQWEPIQLGTLLARLRRTGFIGKPKPGKETEAVQKAQADPAKAGVHKDAKNTKTAIRLNKTNKELDRVLVNLRLSGILVTLKHSKGNAAKKMVFSAGHIFGIAKDKKTGRVSDTLKRRITPQEGGYQIGVDKGMQRQSLQPGKGKGDAGPNLLYAESSVTVGATMHYSPEFDKHRQIIPDKLPDAWLTEIEKTVAEYGAELIQHAFEGKTNAPPAPPTPKPAAAN